MEHHPASELVTVAGKGQELRPVLVGGLAVEVPHGVDDLVEGPMGRQSWRGGGPTSESGCSSPSACYPVPFPIGTNVGAEVMPVLGAARRGLLVFGVEFESLHGSIFEDRFPG